MIALDLDGTLEDSRDDMVAAVARTRMEHGLPPLEDAEIRPNVSKGMPHLYATCLGELSNPAPEFARQYKAGIVDKTKLYPGIREALTQLSEPLAVVTNKPERLSITLLEALGILPLISTVIGGDSCTEAKPSPIMLQEAVRRCGGPVIMVGDSAGDIKMAHAFGCPVVWAGWGYLDDAPAGSDAIAMQPQDLPSVIADLVARRR